MTKTLLKTGLASVIALAAPALSNAQVPAAPATPAPRPAPTTTATPTAGAAAAVPQGTATPAATTPNPPVGGAAMDATKTIVENASAAPNLTTLVGAVKAAGLVDTLSGPGPFTVFAPTDEAFGRVDKTTLATLMKPAGKATLTKALTYHVVPGTITIADLRARIAAGGGTAKLTTVEGDPITATIVTANGGEAIALSDMNGNKSYVEVADVRQSNGIVHVVNGVMFPKL